MGDSTLWLTVLACGVGTWLMRVLPVKGGTPRALEHGRLGHFMAAVGPAALAAMLVATLAPFNPIGAAGWLAERQPMAVAALAGIAATAAVQRWRGGLALPTLAGALAYALALRLMA